MTEQVRLGHALVPRRRPIQRCPLGGGECFSALQPRAARARRRRAGVPRSKRLRTAAAPRPRARPRPDAGTEGERPRAPPPGAPGRDRRPGGEPRGCRGTGARSGRGRPPRDRSGICVRRERTGSVEVRRRRTVRRAMSRAPSRGTAPMSGGGGTFRLRPDHAVRRNCPMERDTSATRSRSPLANVFVSSAGRTDRNSLTHARRPRTCPPTLSPANARGAWRAAPAAPAPVARGNTCANA
jgi:hypothetical protein